jgi:hypothetical protein
MILDVDVLEAFRAQGELTSVDSCAAEDNEAVDRLFPDTLAITTLLVPLGGLRGVVAAQAARGSVALGRRVRASRQPSREDLE